MAERQNGRTAERQNGRTAERQNDKTAKRQNGRTAEWQNGRMAPSVSVMPPDNNESTNLGGSGAGLLEIPTDLINADMSATT
jgi:hypothetical protein